MPRIGFGVALAAAVVVGVSFGVGPARAHVEELVDLETRPGVHQRFFLVVPEKPFASAILLPGGDGKVDLEKVRAGKFLDRGNFLVRTRNLFADGGVAVAVVDVPSDMAAGHDGLSRTGADHAKDMAAVADYLKKRLATPVWLIGTSRGTESAASIAVRLGDKIGGLVLTSSITKANRNHTSVLDMGLEKVPVPSLVVAHKDDGCFVTPASDAEKILAALAGASRKKLLMFEGGDPPRSKPCQAMSQHGYIGIEAKVVAAIAGFMKER